MRQRTALPVHEQEVAVTGAHPKLRKWHYQVVRRDQIIEEGRQEQAWDGTDASGNPVGSGIYFYRLTNGDRALVKKMVLVK
jgi:flagellar hook assembly protein FlgD